MASGPECLPTKNNRVEPRQPAWAVASTLGPFRSAATAQGAAAAAADSPT